MTREELLSLVPRTKHDTECVQALADLGYPAISPILPELLEWMQDMNWPVAQVLAPFLASIGLPLVPHLRLILSGDDDIWKRWAVTYLIGHSAALRAEFRPELERMAAQPTDGERGEDIDEVAREILDEL